MPKNCRDIEKLPVYKDHTIQTTFGTREVARNLTKLAVRKKSKILRTASFLISSPG